MRVGPTDGVVLTSPDDVMAVAARCGCGGSGYEQAEAKIRGWVAGP